MRTWTVGDVMTAAVVSVPEDAPYRTVVDVLTGHRISAAPVVGADGRVAGVVSETDLLRKVEFAGDEEPQLFEGRRRRAERSRAAARTVRDLMSTPPVVARRDTTVVAAARLMDREGVKRLPVVDEGDRPVGIVTRGDLLKVHLRPDEDIRADVRDGVLRVFLAEDADAVQVDVADGVVTVAGPVGRWSSADLAARLTRQVAGVVAVVDMLTWEFDDREIVVPRAPFGAE